MRPKVYITISLCLVVSILFGGSLHFSPVSFDQTNALLAYEKICNTLKWDEKGHPIYPDEYGGEYIDGDILYVWIANYNGETLQKYQELCGDSSYVRFLKAEYSLNELNEYKEMVKAYVKEYNISAYAVDRKENRVRVYVSDACELDDSEKTDLSLTAEQSIALLSQILNPDIYVFEEQSASKFCVSIHAGDSIHANGSCTLGACGTYNNQPAILTAGHCVPFGGTHIRYGGATDPQFATVSMWQCDDYFAGDYAIATIDSSLQSTYLTTGLLAYAIPTYSIDGIMYNGWAPVGTTVYAHNPNGTFVTTIVTAVDVTVNLRYDIPPYSSVDVQGLIYCYSPTSATIGGASGGPVCMYIPGVGTYLLGTVSGGNGVNSTYYSPISYPIADGFTVLTN